ncbi:MULTISPECIES: UDP-glucose 4-epimerase GalE [Bacillus cereus group]|uniref:UDP-glucose 4-epimerase GalE n=1 Tax=Bacillus cereus group TaxID=86661 RepID=UPI00032E6249|nr:MULTISPECIES: UDP-glucose 4-epimerase GalE [Bacillus cereus group]EOP57451.1 UDP-glucose 4-epimerase [Bacillus cereus VD136]EOP75129.1 UDP-glucose 4-epimerase [Bacillus cereus VDM006]EOQ14845.1 UDP-glucose 4-epimerase [Bacillus cereus VDM021]OOG91463.1 UDP-glucose 4-epimerase [Bacillus mycoides]PEK72363.1 UDP-glucose 4-epimerase GalE [Bacillus pseudomycoides]
MILVLGGAGYIGSHAVKELLNKGYDVLVIDNLSTGNRQSLDSRAVFVKGNIGDYVLLEQVFTQYNVEAVMHFAASCLVGESISNPLKYYENNVVNSFNLLEAMVKHNIKKIIFSSTCATYGLAENEFLNEKSPTSPINPYGRSKLIVEQMIDDCFKTYGVDYIILRYFNVAGADFSGLIGEHHNPETHLIPNVLLHLSGKSKYISVFGNDFSTADGTCIRDYIHVLDLIEAHILSLQALLNSSPMCRIYNIGNNRGYSVKQIIEQCERITKKKANIVYERRREGDPPYLVASVKKVCEELGWVPKYSLEDMIRSAQRWHRINPDGYNN